MCSTSTHIHRQCEMKVPKALVEKMEKLPGGIRPILKKIEKEFGLHTASSYMGSKNYTIIGPNPELLELAMQTLMLRFTEREERGSDLFGEIDDGRRAIWKFQGDYAVKVSQLFKTEIEEISQVPSVKIHVAPLKLEITSSLDDVDIVKPMIDKLQEDIHSLVEADIEIVGSHVELVKLRQFIHRKLVNDETVVCILNEHQEKFTVFAKTDDNLRRVMDEWETVGKIGNKAQRMASSTFSYSSVSQHPHYKSEMKLPGGLVRKLEKQREGIDYILGKIEKEFGLKVDYIRHKHLKIFGPHLDVLDLAAQTLVHLYVIKKPPENGVFGLLQGKNAVWKFVGNYAKKVIHLFTAELKQLRRVKTVCIKAHPCKINPVSLEILCSVRVVEKVKSQVEKIVGEVHHLHEREIKISNDAQEISRVKHLITIRNDQGEVLCLYEETSRKLKILGRNEIFVNQMVTELREDHRRHPRDEMPDEFWTMYRQLYQTKIPDETVHMLEQAPGGIIPVIQRIEKEFGVKTMYNRKKQMVLISPTEDVLELAQETLKSRYIHENNESRTDESQQSLGENANESETGNQSAADDTDETENQKTSRVTTENGSFILPEIDTTVHKLHNLHHGYTPPPPRSRPRKKSPVKSIFKRRPKLPYRSSEKSGSSKKVMFAEH